MSAHEIEEMIDEADADKNGTVEIDEFMTVMEKHAASEGEQGWARLRCFDAIGGEAGVTTMTEKMYEKVMSDPLLASYFTEIDIKKLVAAQAKYICAAMGGP